MRVIVEDGLSIGWTIHSFKAGEKSACFALKTTYQLQPGRALILAEETAPLSGDKHADDDPGKSLLYPTDLAPLKPRADVVLVGTAHAPQKKPVPSFPVRMQVGKLSKTLTVHGLRKWQFGFLGKPNKSEPQPIAELPLTYQNAFGGEGYAKNPVGRGTLTITLPAIEDPKHPFTNPKEDLEPAGFAPLAASWEQRSTVLRNYRFNDKWRKERWPWFPEDFDYGYFNAAPRDQQVEGYLKGDEELLFENLHPEHAVYRSRLPGRRTRCFLQELDAKGQPGFREVPLKLDTLSIDLLADKLILVWRGHVPVRTIKLKEVDKVLAWTDSLSEPPRPASHCVVFLAERQRADDAEFEEVESAEEAAAEEAARAESAKELAEFDREMAAADKEITAANAASDQQFAQVKAQLIAGGADPAQLEPKAAQSPSEALRIAIKDSEKTHPERAAALRADLPQVEGLDAEFTTMEKEYDANFPEKPTKEEILARIARRESMAEMELSAMDLSGQDLSGVDFQGASLREAVLKGANLQKANLTDADLGKADLSGADLTQAILNDADLKGATLTGARLAGVSIGGADLSGLKLAEADLSGSVGKWPDFSGCDLTKARFNGAKLPFADFSNAQLAGADFRNAEVPRADFDGAKAAGINWEGADLSGASFNNGADLRGGNFQRVRGTAAVFSDATLDQSDFRRAQLAKAQFPDASLREANFDRADLSAAAFDGAMLKKAQLTNANLLRANFAQANLTEADLRGSNLYEAGFWETVLEKTDLRNANLKGTTLA